MFGLGIFSFLAYGGFLGLLLGFILFPFVGGAMGAVYAFTIPPADYIQGILVVAAIAFIVSLLLRIVGVRGVQVIPAVIAAAYAAYQTWVYFDLKAQPIWVIAMFAISAALFTYGCGVIPGASECKKMRYRQLRPVPHLFWLYTAAVMVYLLTNKHEPPELTYLVLAFMWGLLALAVFGSVIKPKKEDA